MTTFPQHPRYGFHYFPDSLHYRESDALRWVPELKALGAGWLTLRSSPQRAIPESFIQALLDGGIQPIVHIPLAPGDAGISDEVGILCEAYASWGVKYIAFFDRPNLKVSWGASAWSQSNLVHRFIELYLPLAEAAVKLRLTPIFPPLEPGGDYWDTAFLLSSLKVLKEMGCQDVLQNLAISAYGWAGNRSLDWGAGGPERWPLARPYAAADRSEDQRGFRIFDWYLAISQAALGTTLPILLLAAGSKIGDQSDPRTASINPQSHALQNLAIARLIQGQVSKSEPIAQEVLACNFWLLSASQGDREEQNAWYKASGEQLPVVAAFKEWAAGNVSSTAAPSKYKTNARTSFPNPRPIAHYLLLPTYEWGMADLHLDAIRPFINKYQPTIGFSLAEASHAKRVTVIGSEGSAPEEVIDSLLAAGCIVEQISGDGMNIASKLASRAK